MKFLFGIVCLLAVSVTGYAQPGLLDTTFGTAGTANPTFGSRKDFGAATALQSDGKILVAGYTFINNTNDFTLTRLNRNGSLDTTFGDSGRVTTDVIPGSNDFAYAVAVQTDQKILVAGSSSHGGNSNVAVVRYNSTGRLDTTFGDSGIVDTPITIFRNDVATSIALQADGKIVVGGYTFNGSTNDVVVVRYKTNGDPDSTFGTAGIVTTDIFLAEDYCYSVAVQPDRKILIGGSSVHGGNSDILMLRYRPDGRLDSTFGTFGIVTLDIGGGTDNGFAVALEKDTSIVLTGNTAFDGSTAVLLLHYRTDGSLDRSFGSSGLAITDIGSANDDGYSVLVQPDGKILVAGESDKDFCLIRFTSNGLTDPTFGSAGVVVTDFSGGNDHGRGILMQRDGKIVVAGYSQRGSNYDLAAARYLSGLSTGGVYISVPLSSATVFPNPVGTSARLDYELSRPEILSIRLTDIRGNTMVTLLNCKKRDEGRHSEWLHIPASLPPGNYFLTLESGSGEQTIRVSR